MVSSRNPGQRRTGGRRRSVKQSSQGPAVGRPADPWRSRPHRERTSLRPRSQLELAVDAGRTPQEVRMPADRGRHRLLAVHLQPNGQMIRAELEALDGPARERPVRTEIGRDRVVADQPPTALVDRPVDRVWRQARAQGVGRAGERERRVADAARERRHRERPPGDRAVAVGLEELAAIDRQRREATAGDEVDDRADAGRRELQQLRIGCGVGQADGQRPTAGGCRRAEWGALGDQLVDRRRRPEDLLVEADDDPADALADRLALLLRHRGSLAALGGQARSRVGHPRAGRPHSGTLTVAPLELQSRPVTMTRRSSR